MALAHTASLFGLGLDEDKHLKVRCVETELDKLLALPQDNILAIAPTARDLPNILVIVLEFDGEVGLGLHVLDGLVNIDCRQILRDAVRSGERPTTSG